MEMSTNPLEKPVSNNQLPPSSAMPSWLMSTLADLEERVKLLAIGTTEEDEMGDTFAERAKFYYQTRPQLLALLQDLYNGYITLSDRYVLTLAKQNHRRHSSQVSTIGYGCFDYEEESGAGVSQIDSDLESSLSYQQPPMLLHDPHACLLGSDAVVAELVMKNVEYDLLMNEIDVMERRQGESLRKMDLQKSLVEVLESERLILLNENAKLGYRVSALAEENKGLASESQFMKRKAAELARCVLKMREDHRVYMLHRKIEDLQAQVCGLEKRNKEYYEELVKRENPEVKNINNVKGKNTDGVSLEVCFQVGRLSKRWKRDGSNAKEGNGKKASSWWKKVRNIDLLLCGSSPACNL